MKTPLWMPEGSVRSILALVVVVAATVGYFVETIIPLELVTLVLGFYFGQRNAPGA